jgi:asparagine synthase (glutamine-hydrolysing)
MLPAVTLQRWQKPVKRWEENTMCGIVGIFGQPGSVDAGRLERATAALYHRGPDGQRHWLAADRSVGLGHARLSIIDLEGGSQPLANEDGSIVAVVNGEIYDFETLRAELEREGHRFATCSDSEVLIHLYEDLGLDALQRLRGEFAFVLWDSRARRLVAGRDRFGIKPLFHARHAGQLYFASEAKALFAAGVPARWDEESFYQMFHTGGPLPSRSLFHGVSPIPPGHVMVVTADHERLHRYWDFNYPIAAQTAVGTMDREEAIARFRALFEESVRLRLRADVPVGVYLSGGLDSCSILGVAARLHGAGLKAFNLSFEQAAYDEEAIAREMAELAGAEYHSVKVTQAALARNFVSSVRHAETLVFNSHGVAKFMLSEVVRDAGFKVVLTGEGSDEILAGYPHFRRDLLLYSEDHGQEGGVEEALEQLRRKNAVSRNLLLPDGAADLGKDAVSRRIGFVPSWLEGNMRSSRSYLDFVAESTRRSMAGHDPYAWFLNDLDVAGQLTGRHPLNQSLYLWSKATLPNYLLTVLGDRMEMAHSIEGRVPFLDHHLVEFATTLPIDLKIRDMSEKYILRQALKPDLTTTVYERQKHPFIAPPSGAARSNPFSAFLRDYIGDHRRSVGIFDPKKVDELLLRMDRMTEDEHQAVDPLFLMMASTVALEEQLGLS